MTARRLDGIENPKRSLLPSCGDERSRCCFKRCIWMSFSSFVVPQPKPSTMTTSRKLITLTTVWTVLLLLTVGVVPAAARADDTSSSAQTCSIDPNEIDPALVEMEYVDLSDGKKKKTMVYMEPDVTTFYEGQELPASTKVVPKFNGFAGNVFNVFGIYCTSFVYYRFL